MTPERFETLADAYGADLARWPLADRAEAERWLAQTPGAAVVLLRARRLDEALASFETKPVTADLQRRIVTALLRRRVLAARLRGWVSGLGAVGVLGAGAAAGAAAMALVTISAPPRSDLDAGGALYEQSSFGDLPAGSDVAQNSART